MHNYLTLYKSGSNCKEDCGGGDELSKHTFKIQGKYKIEDKQKLGRWVDKFIKMCKESDRWLEITVAYDEQE